MTPQPQPTTTLAELAIALPAASRVFHRHGLDFCCHGGRPLAEACAERGLDPQAVLAEVATEGQGVTKERWDQRSLGDLVEFIVGYYHARLRTELPELLTMAERVETRHAEKASCPRGLAAHIAHVHQAVLEHLEKEEQILFPMLRSGRGSLAAGPIQVMELEHDDHAASLRRTRALTTDLVPPEEACNTWRALYLRLAEFEAELMEHIHLENHVLFQRALCA